MKAFGGIDVLVNNAAFQVHSADFADLTEKHFDTTLKTNLYGYFHMAQEAVPHMKPGSAIVNTGSVTGIEGSKELIDYSMTKGGIHAFTRALSLIGRASASTRWRRARYGRRSTRRRRRPETSRNSAPGRP